MSSKWGTYGTGQGQLTDPIGICFDINGNIMISDSAGKMLDQFDSSGNFLTRALVSGSSPGNFNSPNGMGIDWNGILYMTDTGNNRVVELNSQGFLQAFVVRPEL